MFIDEQHEKVNPNFVPSSLVTPAFLASPVFRRGRGCGEMFNLSQSQFTGSIYLLRPCLVPAMPG